MNAAAAALVVLNGRQAFDPRASLFAHNEPGFWYDPSDYTTLFQDSAGTTPVTAVEQAVGLILDKSRGLVLGSELFSNQAGTFDNTSGGATTTYTSATQTVSVTVAGTLTSYPRLTIDLGLTVGRTYLVSGRIDGTRTGVFGIRLATLGSANDLSYNNSTGVFQGRVAAGATSIQFLYDGTVTGSRNIATLSVRELAGNHAIQPGATNRPILRSRYNLLTYSEQFDNAAWTKSSSTVTANTTTAPDGTLTADRVTSAAATAITGVYKGRVYTVAATYTSSFYVKKDVTIRYLQLLWTSGAASTDYANFDLDTGTVTDGTYAGATMSSVGGGWFRITLTSSLTASSDGPWLTAISASNAGRAGTFAGTTAESFLVWGAQLLTANDATALSNRYQRIAAATDYDTVGFPVYLAFDGSDDSLYTGGSIDFSATDRMTVFAGVTKLSDAARGVLLEFSASSSNPGTFSIEAPSVAGDPRLTFFTTGSATVSAGVNNAAYAAPLTAVLTGISDIGADIALLRSDGVQVASNTNDQGTGNYASAVLNIGRRNNASLPFNGRLYQLIGRGAATSAALITQADRWVAGKQGRAL